jgi:hypothetical protein
MARLTYLVIIFISVLIGVFFFGLWRERFAKDFLILFSLLPMLLFATGVHGLVAHSFKPSFKAKYGAIFYPVLMGVLFVVLLMIHFFVILPLICPEFMRGCS